MYIGALVVTLDASQYMFQLDWLSQSCATAVCVWSCFITKLRFATQKNIEQRYANKFCVKLNKSATETYAFLTFKNRASYIYRTGVPLPSRCCILYIFFSTSISTEYFKHAAHSPFFSSKCRLFHNATFFGSCIIHILHTVCAKI
jgi:hypothetical protein